MKSIKENRRNWIMSSFHQVCLIAKGKVEDCRALCEELEAEGYEEGYVPVPAR